jgi:plasmid stability protein
MASLTIRRLDDGVKERLRIRAARHGRSMEEEARQLLSQAVKGETRGKRPLNLAESFRRLVAPLGGVELELPPREPVREPPNFE